MTSPKSNYKIDVLNLGLIVVSLLLAIYLPFELFLIAYAVLGPLHYMTEINWIKDKQYFTTFNPWIWLSLFFSLVIVVPKILLIPDLIPWSKAIYSYSAIQAFNKYTNIFLFVVFGLAVSQQFTQKTKYLLGHMVFYSLVAYLLNSNNHFTIWVGLFLPTLIHVYVFTMLFMLYGAKKSKSRIAYINVIVMALVPLLVYAFPIHLVAYNFSDYVKQVFVDNHFYNPHVTLSKLLGLSEGKTFFFYEETELRIQIFVAFAYVYHYFNWFTKTSIIQWHKSLNKRRFIVIGLVWALSVSFFYYDYKVGLAFTLFLSFLHVILEFPINTQSIKYIFFSDK